MTVHVTSSPRNVKLRVEALEGGAIWSLRLDCSPGNVLDAAMTAELSEVFHAAREAPDLKAIILGAEGEHFCFGASVKEHQAEQVAAMLRGFHELFRQIAEASVPLIAAVRGVCLGGGLELAAFCQRIFAHPESSYGQPEIALGVFAPVGSAILAERVGRAAADELLLTGRTLKAPEALEMGLLDELAADPEEAALAWVRESLLPRSASSLRWATRAARFAFMRRFEEDIDGLEKMYLEQLMSTHDANEGIAAFLGKRKPKWSNS